MTKERRENQVTKIRNETEDITTHFKEIKRITGNIVNNWCPKVDNLDEINTFIET